MDFFIFEEILFNTPKKAIRGGGHINIRYIQQQKTSNNQVTIGGKFIPQNSTFLMEKVLFSEKFRSMILETIFYFPTVY